MYKFKCLNCGYSIDNTEHNIDFCPSCYSENTILEINDLGDNHPHFVNELEQITKKHNEIKSSNKCQLPKIRKEDVKNFKEKLKGIETF